MQRLQASAQSRSHRLITNIVIAVVAIELLAIMYFFPSVTVMLVLACSLMTIALMVVAALFYIVNEICWLVCGKRFR